MKMSRIWSVVALCACVIGCDAPAGQPAVGTSSQALRAGVWDVAGLQAQLASGEEVLALLSDGGALVSLAHEAPEFSDQAKLLDVRRIGRLPMPIAAEIPLEDAQPVFGGAIYAITVDRDLVELGADGRVARTIEGPVQGPLSVSADGKRVAYMRGDAPELAPVVLDVTSGAAREVRALGFAWGAAISEDGRMVSFVEGGERGPTLVRASADGEGREVLDAAGSFPVGTRAPLWLGERLVFEAERGLVVWTPGEPLRALPGAMPVRVPGASDQVLVHGPGGQISLVSLDGKE